MIQTIINAIVLFQRERLEAKLRTVIADRLRVALNNGVGYALDDLHNDGESTSSSDGGLGPKHRKKPPSKHIIKQTMLGSGKRCEYHTTMGRFFKLNCVTTKRVQIPNGTDLGKMLFPTPTFWAPTLFQLRRYRG